MASTGSKYENSCEEIAVMMDRWLHHMAPDHMGMHSLALSGNTWDAIDARYSHTIAAA
jgi:hypothetical protein